MFKVIILGIILIPSLMFAQNSKLRLHQSLKFPKDSVVGNNIINSLDSFLIYLNKSYNLNPFILPDKILESTILFDEIKGAEINPELKDSSFYKPYLSNISKIDDNKYLVSLSYLGISNNLPIMNSNFDLLAEIYGSKVYFNSLLKLNTLHWKSIEKDKAIFHYKSKINEKNIDDFIKYKSIFDNKLGKKDELYEWYGCNDINELYKLIGVNFKLSTNGLSYSGLSSENGNQFLTISGSKNQSFDRFDPHDLWHHVLHRIVPLKTINRYVDEGCAYLYGGSWGLSWEQIFDKFTQKVNSDSSSNWLKIYGEFNNFNDSKQDYLIPGYVINALVVDKLEKEKGFESVMELLCCGMYEKNNIQYFKTLDKLLGINESNFNDKVWELIRNYKMKNTK